VTNRDRAIQASLDEVAAIYYDNPKAPTQAVQRALNVSWRTAARRVAAAREAGLISPSRAG
jgi:DNA-binding transcriptional regulator LsrR (DeoR family)